MTSTQSSKPGGYISSAVGMKTVRHYAFGTSKSSRSRARCRGDSARSLRWAELRGVHEDADDDVGVVSERAADEGEVAFVEGAHRWHEADGAGSSRRGRPALWATVVTMFIASWGRLWISETLSPRSS